MSTLNIANKRFSEIKAIKKKSAFELWLITFINEKGIKDVEFTVEGESGTNTIPLMVVAEHMITASAQVQAQIKHTLVKIDFLNGDECHYFKHLAESIAL